MDPNHLLERLRMPQSGASPGKHGIRWIGPVLSGRLSLGERFALEDLYVAMRRASPDPSKVLPPPIPGDGGRR